METETKNTIASASKGMRSLYAPRSARDDQGAHKIGRIDDGACEPNFDPKIFGLSEINSITVGFKNMAKKKIFILAFLNAKNRLNET